MWMSDFSNSATSKPSSAARAFASVSAACALSFITSPSWPVRMSLPLPGQAGWLLPQRDSHAYQFSEIDLARAHLIRDLKYDLEVNDEGIPIILDLVDQLH